MNGPLYTIAKPCLAVPPGIVQLLLTDVRSPEVSSANVRFIEVGFFETAAPQTGRTQVSLLEIGYRPYSAGRVRSHSPIFSPIMMQVRFVLARGTLGMMDASAITSPGARWAQPY